MGEYLPGNLQERLRELREKNGYSTRQKLAEELGIDKSTYGRIESGETKTINSDLLVQLSNLYNVSTDYILGLTDVPQKTYFDLAELGLSVEAAKNLISRKDDPRVVNALLTNEKFAVATSYMASYFSDVMAIAFGSQDTLNDLVYDFYNEFSHGMKMKRKKDVSSWKKLLRLNKVNAGPYEVNRIQRQLMAAVTEIKKDVSNEIHDFCSETITAEAFEYIKNGIMSEEGLMDLSMPQKTDRLVKQVQLFMHERGGIPGNKEEDFDKAVEIIFPLLVELMK